MPKICDNKSVGMVVRRDDEGQVRFLMIDRGNYPRCKAMPAGHLDGGQYADMAVVETLQETGIQVVMRDMSEIYQGPLANPCKRDGGSWHHWSVYFADGCSLPHFNIKAGDDAKRAFWATEEELKHYAIRTEWFFSKLGLEWREEGTLTLKVFGDPKTGPVTDAEKALYDEWQRDPGLEPVWYFMLRTSKKFFGWTFQDAPVAAT